MVSRCVCMHKVIQLQHRYIYHTTTDLCQHCLANLLPFQSLDDLDYEFTVSNGINISEDEMDRLMHLKFNPFDTSNHIALSETTQISINRQKYIANIIYQMILKNK
jgi:hypothetical protein